MQLKKITGLNGIVTVPGDKSISHRLVILGSIAKGTTKIHHFLNAADCLATINCFKKMGVEIFTDDNEVTIRGRGLHGLKAPAGILDAGNSGTTARLLCGILAGQSFSSEISGDRSLSKRPMDRIISPLSAMGADISDRLHNGCLPLAISGGKLHGADYKSKISSAQVKSAVLLAGLYADGTTAFTEPSPSRNHTEILLRQFGARISAVKDKSSARKAIKIFPCEELYGGEFTVPGDISSAAYFIAAGLIVPNSKVLIKNVGINPTRAGIIDICRKMGGEISILNRQTRNGEECADILVQTSELKGITIEGGIIPSLIDEIPIIAVMAAFAHGTTVIKDAAELKVKESNRIETITKNLKAMGCKVQATDDGMIIEGGTPLQGTIINPLRDHRVAMAFSIAGLNAAGTTTILDSKCTDISYPNFFETLKSLHSS